MTNKYFGGVVENKGVEGDVDEDFKKVVLEAPVKAAEKMDKLTCCRCNYRNFCII